MIVVVSVLVFLSLACTALAGSGDGNDASGVGVNNHSNETPTPTIGGGDLGTTLTPVPSACSGLSGALEMQVLVGPAETVGLTPISMGNIPFTVVSEGEAYLIQGAGSITYEETLEAAWGTYTVSFDMQSTLDGACSGQPGSEYLDLTVEVSGDQMVEVRSDGFQGDYPWSGTHTLNLSFPLEEGAVMEGEGWAFILHFN